MSHTIGILSIVLLIGAAGLFFRGRSLSAQAARGYRTMAIAVAIFGMMIGYVSLTH
ncbi:hypothetical protein [Xanthomonas theicola]|uniref:hypothetical protein n=1 Tax=Xanthomonas theicola TaxID=56464 RepID=UPI001304888B|nr:hypothetical protein [Xanthomonas theicola]QNH27192.1 hypothetical protein G4Q83_22230 [Xanthomonas theicola]